MVAMKDIETRSYGSIFPLYFYGVTKILKPLVCVELGTYAGNSAYYIAAALKSNHRGNLYCYDLWDSYAFHHVSKVTARRNLVGLPVALIQKNAFDVYRDYCNNSVDLLSVDLSNDGDVYRRILTDWYKKLTKDSVVLLEGGSSQRDKVSWMTKFKKTPIKTVFEDDDLNKKYEFDIIHTFPSLTTARKRC